MADAQQPLLAYNRIETNERKTRWLIAAFGVALLPVVTGLAVFVLPWISMIVGAIAYAVYGPALPAKLEALNAQVSASLPTDRPVALLDLPRPVLMQIGALLLAAFVVVVLLFFAITARLIARYGSRMVLRTARARAVDRSTEPDLFRLVENLSIGAGLPMPSLHLIESGAPNAFATGFDPQHASLAVTRGLLTLLDRRGLEGVIAHELSHIGNHDIRLTTTLAALVGAASLPFRMMEGIFRAVFRAHWAFGVVVLWLALPVVVSFVQIAREFFVGDSEILGPVPPFLWWWMLHGMTAPFYAVFVAPIVALLIRQAVSREREFLADADAVLITRDPEGLALALLTIGAARGEPLRVGEGSVHLYFVDPASDIRSVLHAIFPSHPSIEQRVELLGRMGSGINPSAAKAAIAAGKNSLPVASVAGGEEVIADEDVAAGEGRAVPPIEVDEQIVQAGVFTPLYEQADGWSRVLAHLPVGTALTVTGADGNFVRVRTADNLSGYIARSSPLAAVHLP